MKRISDTNPSGSQLGGRTLAAARAAWLAVFALGTTLFILGLRPQFVAFETVCSGAACANLQLNLTQVQDLQRLGISLRLYAAYFTSLSLLSGLVFLSLAALIFGRKRDDRMALLCSVMLITWGTSGFPDVIGRAYPSLRFIALLFQALGNVCITLFFFLFPDGWFAPNWVRWLAPLIILREFLSALLPFNTLFQNLFFVELPIGLFSVFYRYWRVSNAAQRQQTKWVVFGLIVGGGGYAAVLLPVILTMSGPGTATSALEYIVGGTALELFILLIPISIGIAILRARLWDIDLLIRRTLVYSVLVGSLAAAYFGSVVVLQELVGVLTGQRQSALVTVFSTLLIAALFMPLRRRVQSAIDQRFYRRKYDAAQTLTAFGAALRDETELDRLTERLLGVVEETMQPVSVSLWLWPAADHLLDHGSRP
jgi:hypothetical protein